MSLDQLDTPLRMTWTLGEDELSVSDVMLLADRVAAAGLFFLTLQGNFCIFPKLPELLDRLVQAGIQVSLVVDPRLPVDRLSAEMPIQQLMLDCTFLTAADRLDLAVLETAASRLKQAGIRPSLQLIPLRGNLALLPRLFTFAGQNGIDRVVLPNVPLADEIAECFSSRLLSADDIETFRQSWSGLKDQPRPKELVVHDLFLWEILCPEQGREHYSGCQAGNSLSHLDRKGILFPCSAWAQPLGSLLKESVADLWHTPDRAAVLGAIASSPAGCDDCSAWHTCFGGCRGLARSFGQQNSGRDLMCPEKR